MILSAFAFGVTAALTDSSGAHRQPLPHGRGSLAHAPTSRARQQAAVPRGTKSRANEAPR